MILSGAMSTARMWRRRACWGPTFAYLGTRFLATREALAAQGHKDMIVAAEAKDILYTPAISGVNANFLVPSIERNGLDPQNLPAHAKLDMASEAKVWRDVWSAGQGVGSIHDVPSAAELGARLIAEYADAWAHPPSGI